MVKTQDQQKSLPLAESGDDSSQGKTKTKMDTIEETIAVTGETIADTTPTEHSAEIPSEIAALTNKAEIVEEDHKSNPNSSGIASVNVIMSQPPDKSRVLARKEGGNPESGTPYVNMLNNQSYPVPVMAQHVIHKLVEGYRFIDGESCVPARAHNSGPVKLKKTIVPRRHPSPEDLDMAKLIWKRAVEVGRTGEVVLVPQGVAASADAEVEEAMAEIGIQIADIT